MGTTYRAWDLRLEKPVVVKEMLVQPGLAPREKEQLFQQFFQEAHLLARLNHPNLVRGLDYFSGSDSGYYVTEFIEGEPVSSLIAREGALPEHRVLDLARQLLDALAFCHNQNVIHRDIKPSNVMVTPEGRAVLMDFGLAKLYDPNEPITAPLTRGMGTPEYAPPEQYATRTAHTDSRSDIYGLGATLYHMLAGQPPPTAVQLITNPASFVPLSNLNLGVSARTGQAVTRAMALQPNERFQSAAEMANALFTAPAPAVSARPHASQTGALEAPELVKLPRIRLPIIGRYQDYYQLWRNSTPLNRLIVLLISGPLRPEEIAHRLAQLHIPVDAERLETELQTGIRDGLLTRQSGQYSPADRFSARVLQIREGGKKPVLVEQILQTDPLYVETRRFLTLAGFVVSPADKFGFICTTNSPLWKDVTPLYVRLVLARPLDIEEFQSLCKAAATAYGRDVHGHTALVVIDRPPRASDLFQIFALRADRGFTIVPLPRSAMAQARPYAREMETLKEQLEIYMGRTNLYDARTAVTDVLSFFGRSALLANLERQLTGGRPVMLFGVRKVGKSSLMGRALEELHWPAAVVDLEGYGGGLRYVYEEALRSWQSAIEVVFPGIPLPGMPPGLSAPDAATRGQAFRQAVVALLNVLSGRSGRPGLLLFLDEMDVLFSQPEYHQFAAVLRGITESPSHRGRFVLLAAGLEPTLNRVDHLVGNRNPFFSFFEEIPVGPLELEDARTMIVSIGGQMGISYDQQALDLLVSAGGGHPFLTRQLCSTAIQNLELPARITVERVYQAMEAYLRWPRNYLAESLWGVDQGGPSGFEAQLLISLARHQPQTEATLFPLDASMEYQRAYALALAHLNDQSLVRRGQTGWELTVPLYRHWIRRYVLHLEDNVPVGGV
ncbi:MAG: serine/threonine-protein kinase PknK [Anaerolineae bacterium]|nr:serine/threonine-protein kinase PknK [Anaerolineae bacterium]